MPYPFYEQNRTDRLPQVPEDLTLIRRAKQNSPKGYRPGKGLVDAVNVALLLGQPLLLTGEAGTGKTELANSLNWQVGFKNEFPFTFETKSTTIARDLFYSYDTIGRFHAAQTKQGSTENRDYINYNALGLAILFANPKSSVIDFLPGKSEYHLIPDNEWQRRSVVLIDEIDKAPRDFPNDILNEIDRMFFRVAELGNTVFQVTEERFRPVVILTSNSEKNLPDAFLRRCIYYNIEFPAKEELKKIIDERLGDITVPRDKTKSRWYDVLIDLFEQLRASGQLVKKPATAELIGWLTAVEQLLKHYKVPDNKLESHLKTQIGQDTIITPTLSVLLKNADDMVSAVPIIKRWMESN